MLIAEILHHKGNEVVTIRPTATAADAVQRLAERRIGALVVRDRFGHVVGIVSEREIVLALARHGASALGMPVQDIMMADVLTCRREDAVRDVMALVTIRRIRHVPVCEGDRLLGIVSIGDLLKSRLDEKMHEVDVLRDLTRARG